MQSKTPESRFAKQKPARPTLIAAPPGGDRIMREREVFATTGRSRAQRWRDERAGRFPKRLRLGPNAVGWLASEIQGWISARAGERAP